MEVNDFQIGSYVRPCDGEAPGSLSAIPYFIDTKQDGKRVSAYPVPDPSNTFFVGSITDNGFMVYAETPLLGSCSGGEGKFVTIYKVDKIVGGFAGHAEYIIDKYCNSSITSENLSCRKTFSGTAEIFEMEMDQ